MIYTVIVAKCSWIVGACVADDGCHIVAHTAQIFLFGLHEFVLYVPKATKTKVDLDTLISFRYSRPHPHRKTKQNNKSARHQKHPVDLNIGSSMAAQEFTTGTRRCSIRCRLRQLAVSL